MLSNFFVDNQLITVLEREKKKRSDAYFDVATTDFLDLNAEQAAVVEQVTSQIAQESNPFLLEGVTGSGKTEVYLHIIDKVLKLGKTAIVLVPEISLTPQMTNRFISRFGKQVAIMHSALSDGEKFDEWRKIKSGQARVVVGGTLCHFLFLLKILVPLSLTRNMRRLTSKNPFRATMRVMWLCFVLNTIKLCC